MYKKMESVIQQLLARSARLYVVCNEGDETMKQFEAKGCKLIEVRGGRACVRVHTQAGAGAGGPCTHW